MYLNAAQSDVAPTCRRKAGQPHDPVIHEGLYCLLGGTTLLVQQQEPILCP